MKYKKDHTVYDGNKFLCYITDKDKKFGTIKCYVVGKATGILGKIQHCCSKTTFNMFSENENMNKS